MPLIDIQTNLKSLTYGEFGSDEPLITKDINSNPSPNGIHLQAVKRVDDLKRIAKLLTSTPVGLKHTANQAMLNTVEQSILTKNKDKTAAGKLLRGLGGTAKQLASTLAQVPVSGTGLHFVEGFAGKLGYLKGVRGHIEYKNNKRQDGTINTRGIIEKSGNIEENNSNLVLEYFSKAVKADGSTESRQQTTTKQLEEFSEYFPKSEKGTWSKRDEEVYNYGSDDENPLGELLGTVTPTYNPEFTLSGTGFNDMDATSAYDVITAKMPMTSSISDAAEIDTETSKLYDDLIRFRFKIITPQTTSGGEPIVTHLNFRAFLDSFTDDYTADWNSFKYIGRAEDFHTYSGFGRTIGFSFKVAALSKSELQPIYDKLNLLAGSLAPTYVGSSYMRGNFTAVTIGDYLVNQTGFLSSLGISWSKDYPVGGRGDDSQLFHILDVNCSFTPVHKFNTTFGSKFINDTQNVLSAIPQEDEQV